MSSTRPSAIVTGAGSGINFAFARILHDRGYDVLIADIALRPESEALVKAASSANDMPKVIFVKTDVTNWSQLENAFDVSEKEFNGVPDIVCPGAGIYEPPSAGFWADKDLESRYKIIDVNLLHPIKMTRIAIRRMLGAHKKGTILHVASVAAETVSLITPLYQASKHGIGSFVMGMGNLEELCGIRVLGVAPGSTGTPLLLEDQRVAGWLDMQKDILLDPSVIGRALIALAENKDGRYPAGTLLEVADESEESWRIVPLYNNPGPRGIARTITNKDKALDEIKKMLELESGTP